MSDGTRVGRASALLASGTIVSRVLGFVRVAVLAQALGNTRSGGADAYQTATNVPNSIYALIGGGLLTAVIVPQIIRASRAEDRGEGYVNKLLTISIIVFAIVTLAATALAPVLMFAFGARGATLALATVFAYWSLPQIFFLGLYTVLGEVLNARRSFGPFTWAPVLNNVVSIAFLAAFIALFGSMAGASPDAYTPQMVAVVGGGATLGIAAQALVLTLAWRRTGLRFRPDFRWRGVGLHATGRAASWTFGMLVATQIAGAIENSVELLATDKGASVATITTSWLIFMLPHSIITVSLVTVFYPRMSEFAAEADLAGLRDSVGQTLRVVLTLIVFADAALLATAMPFATVFNAHGDADAPAMALVLVAYLIGLVPFTALFVVQRCFYALADTRTPFLFTAVQVVLAVAGTLLCSLLPVQYIAAGVATVISLAATAQLGIAAVLLRRRIGGLGGRPVLFALFRAGLAGLPALALGLLVVSALGTFDLGWAASSIGAAIVTILAGGVVGAVGYVAMLMLMRSPELSIAASLLRARLGR